MSREKNGDSSLKQTYGRALRGKRGQTAAQSELLRPGEVAEFLGLSTWTLANWRRDGRGLRYFRFGRRTFRYRLSDLESFLQSRIVEIKA